MQQDGEDLLKGYLAMERELDLFSARERGIPYWEALRYPIYAKLVSDTGLQDYYLMGRARTASQIMRNLAFVWRSLTTNNPFFGDKVDLLILSGAKRVLKNGAQHDIYTDPLIDGLAKNFSFCVLERPFGEFVHKTPAANGPLGYLDFIYALSAVRGRLRLPRLSREAEKLCAEISESIERISGVKVDVRDQLRKLVGRWQVEVPIFRALLRKVRPRGLLVVVSAGNETLIAAAKQEGVPSAELQHGSPAPGKLNYDFPEGILKINFPDFFISFGQFWSRYVHLPLPVGRILPLGFAHISALANRYRDVPRRRQLVFISQRTIGRRLAAYAIDLKRKLPSDIEILYKLHPEEAKDWQGRYPGLAASGIKVIGDTAADLYQILASSTWQIGVYSTALYEGIAFGCRTYVLKAPGWEAMEPLVKSGAAKLVETAADFELAAETPMENLTNDFFADVSMDKVTSCVLEVLAFDGRRGRRP